MIQSVARQPELRGELQGIMWLGFALTEAVVFYGLVGGLLGVRPRLRAPDAGGSEPADQDHPGADDLDASSASSITFFVLKRFAFGPIQKMIDERRERIRESIEEADRAREEARSCSRSTAS